MKIQDLLDKINEANVGLWDMPRYTVTIKDSKGNIVSISDLKVDSEKENITIRLK
jgi:hypothetical protein